MAKSKKNKKKLTYAEIAELLSKKYNFYDKNLQNAVTDAEKNSAKLMLQRISQNLNQLMLSNQAEANIADANNPPANSPNQSIGRRTAMMAQHGGGVPNPNQIPNPNQNGLNWLLARSNMSAEAPDPVWMQTGYKHLAPLYREQTGLHFNHPEFTHDNYKTWMGEEWARQKANLNNVNLQNQKPVGPRRQDGGTAPKNKEGLYGDVTIAELKEHMDEMIMLTGIKDFDPTNSEHVKSLQKAMTIAGVYKGENKTLLSENLTDENAFLSGDKSRYSKGVDGLFGPDTRDALLAFSNAKGDSDGGGDSDEPNFKKFLGNQALNALPGIAKYLEYANTYNTINSMLPPPELSLMNPQYLNTKYDISPQLNALDQQSLLRERALTDSSTKANNVRTNLAGQDASFNNVRNQLYADKFNKESALQNMQSAMNAKAEDENRKTIFDNAMAHRDFINDRSLAQRDFMSGVVGDVMDLKTQRTNRESQMARLNALMPYLNQFGVYDRASEFYKKYPFMADLLGLNTTT